MDEEEYIMWQYIRNKVDEELVEIVDILIQAGNLNATLIVNIDLMSKLHKLHKWICENIPTMCMESGSGLQYQHKPPPQTFFGIKVKYHSDLGNEWMIQ